MNYEFESFREDNKDLIHDFKTLKSDFDIQQ